ncbi:MAG: hypothetical protein ACJ72V_08085, partial [Nitrososphaeraceae archaeon]
GSIIALLRLDSPEIRYGFDSRSLKKFLTILHSADLEILISFDECCSNVRFVLEMDLKLVVENVTYCAAP